MSVNPRFFRFVVISFFLLNCLFVTGLQDTRLTNPRMLWLHYTT